MDMEQLKSELCALSSAALGKPTDVSNAASDALDYIILLEDKLSDANARIAALSGEYSALETIIRDKDIEIRALNVMAESRAETIERLTNKLDELSA
jgi:hypothetical protein